MRRARLARGLTQVELARAVGANPTTISSVERGAAAPTLQTAEILAEALSVSIDALVGRPLPTPPGAAVVAALDRIRGAVATLVGALDLEPETRRAIGELGLDR